MAVATALAIGGIAVSGASAAMSFAQASKQRGEQVKAEAAAAMAMAEARKKLDVNFAETLSIQKEPFELQRDAMLSQGALAIQAGVESDRGAEATAGRVQMAQNEGQAQIRGAMGQELMNIEQQVVNEDSRLRDIGVQLDLGEVEGAQLAARDAQEARTQAMTEGFQGLTSTASQALDMVPLFMKTQGAKGTAKLLDAAKKSGLTTEQLKTKIIDLSKTDPNFSALSAVGGETANLNAILSELSNQDQQNLGTLLKLQGYN